MSAETQVVPTDQLPPAGDPAATPPVTPEEPPRFQMGDSERDVTRQIHANARELARLQKAKESREAELAELETRINATRPKVPERGDELDEDGLVVYRGMRLPKEGADYLRALEQSGLSTTETLREMKSEMAALRNADIEAESAEYRDAMQKHFDSLVSAARQQLIPGLSEKAGKRADKNIWGEFEDRMNARRAAGGDDFQVTDEMIADELDAASRAVRDDFTDMGWKQLKVNREAAALQPPALGGTPAEPGPKDYSSMSAEERAKARAEAGMTKGAISFTQD
jgi:hypothetical protein